MSGLRRKSDGGERGSKLRGGSGGGGRSFSAPPLGLGFFPPVSFSWHLIIFVWLSTGENSEGYSWEQRPFHFIPKSYANITWICPPSYKRNLGKKNQAATKLVLSGLNGQSLGFRVSWRSEGFGLSV